MSTETPEQTTVNYHQAKREKIAAAITTWQATESNAATQPYGDADDLEDALLGQGLQVLPLASSDCRYRVLIDCQPAPYAGQDRPAGPMDADEAAEVFLLAVIHSEDSLAEQTITVRPATDAELVGHAVTGSAHVEELTVQELLDAGRPSADERLVDGPNGGC
ncbi:hypothetical protein [Streptosporangium roseum]|uniref:hypothetical protein n=1 Tax=Streptosporangium roseum TaxID=2001 RepID=UPI0004CCA754|nr:hypothetical protein [Streptosporangium roseum]